MGSQLEEDYHKIIGKITLNLTTLEARMVFHISTLIGNDLDLGKRITAGEPFLNQLRILDSIFRYRIRDEKQIEKFAELVNKLQKVNEERNQLVHGVWIFWGAGEQVIPTRSKASKQKIGKFKDDRNVPTIEQLKHLADDMENIEKMFFPIFMENHKAVKLHQKLMDDINTGKFNQTV